MDYIVNDAELTATADSIREKTGDTALIEWVTGKGFADVIAGIESGSTNGVYIESNQSFSSSTITFKCDFRPKIVVAKQTGLAGGSSDRVGLAIHIEKDDGTVYQEKWRFQSTTYMIGTSVENGSLFEITSSSGGYWGIHLTDADTSYGKLFTTNNRLFVIG